ncbi:MAG: SUMF1/EgtB/PvdO family nonheme iron enzyme [Planctomycetes bacterium]|nr:SUMF1/EgtB/PvdO family nonheme iron enzyme [Planctomycetota bacterium]
MTRPREKHHFIADQVVRILCESDTQKRRECLDPQLLRPMRKAHGFTMDTTGLDSQQEYLKQRTLKESALETSWHELQSRQALLDREIVLDNVVICDKDVKSSIPDAIPLSRMCVVSDAGMGKSKLIDWLRFQLNATGGSVDRRIAIQVDLAAFERKWNTNKDAIRSKPLSQVLMEHLADELVAQGPEIYRQNESAKLAVETVLKLRGLEGNLTLLADGLDQISDKSDLLAEFLNSTDNVIKNIRLIVASRSNTVLMRWKKVFCNAAWTFVRVEPFTVDQQMRYLGWIETAASNQTPARRELRYSKIPETARELLCIPRVLEYLREVDNYQDIRTAADVYFQALETMIARGMATRPKEYDGVEVSEVLELLARQAFQSFDIQSDHSARTFTSGKPSKAADPVPAYLYDIPEFESVQQYDQFEEQICQRANGGLKTKFEQVWKAVQHLNQFLNYGIFDEVAIGQSNRRIVWANRSLHEFLLAFYFANYASKEESQYLWDWIYLPDRDDSDHYYPFWQFLCEMPSMARTASVWLESIAMLYEPNIRKQSPEDNDPRDEGYGFYSKRSNEMIYRSWETLDAYTQKGFPNVKARANTIRERWWGEFEGSFLKGDYGVELKAIAEEIKDHLLLIPEGTVKLGTTRQRQRWDEDLQLSCEPTASYRNMESFCRNRLVSIKLVELAGVISGIFGFFEKKGSKKTIPEPEAFLGATYDSNPELSIGAFELGRQTISNAWYRLYNPRHTGIISEYKVFSETAKHPAVAISFFDAWVYCQWLRWDKQSCRLPWEIEWEYAAKYKFETWEQQYWWEGAPHHAAPEVFLSERINCDETTDKSKNMSGCTVVPDPSRASPRTKELDAPQGKGLIDMHGNTWEWCQDRYRTNYAAAESSEPFASQESLQRGKRLESDAAVSRVLRGGSFLSDGLYASASTRAHNYPTNTNFNIGFRVARALKGKP